MGVANARTVSEPGLMETSKGACGHGEARGLRLTAGRWVGARTPGWTRPVRECAKREREERHWRQNERLFGGAGRRGERGGLRTVWGESSS